MSLLIRCARVIAGFAIAVSSSAVFAGANPISYSLSPSEGLPSATTVGSSYSGTYTLKNNLPFSEKISQVKLTTTGTNFTISDHCSGVTLASQGTCTLGYVFQPTTAGSANLQLTLYYNKNVVPLPKLSTTVSGNPTPPETDVSGVVTQPLPSTVTANDSYQVSFTFTNNTESSIIPITVESTDNLTNVSGCSDPLPAAGSCTVTGTVTPSSGQVGDTVTVGVTYHYNDASVVLTSSAQVTEGGAGCVSVTGVPSLALPTQTYRYADNIVKFTFTNNCSDTNAILNDLELTASLGSGTHKVKSSFANNWLTPGDNTCLPMSVTHPTILVAGTSCSVTASMVPEEIGDNLTVAATLSYTQSNQTLAATATTSASTVLDNDNTQRMVTVVNQCPFNVWMSFVAAAAPGTPTPTCDSHGNGCPTGTTCYVGTHDHPGNYQCYWSNPALDGQHPNGKLAKAMSGQAPDVMNVFVSENNAGTSPVQNILYNSGIVARRHCTGSGANLSCTSNNCGGTVTPNPGSTDSTGLCAPGVGVSSTPGISFNAAEFTFLRNNSNGVTADGVYDEQTINGINVPIEMKGRGPMGTASPYNAPYKDCAPAGGPIQKGTDSALTQLGSCSYNYQTPYDDDASNYRFVTPTSGACGSCATGDVCGLAYTADGNTLSKTCGKLQGYVSVNTMICSNASLFTDSSIPTHYNCSTSYPDSTPPGPTYFSGAELYACTGAYAGKSCYNPDTSNPNTSCCGCVNWWNAPTSITVPTSTQECGDYANPDWGNWDQGNQGIVLPQIQWVKEACPTAYSYQYDDPSSSFSCTVTNTSQQIVTNYQVTFCPGGKFIPGTEN